MQCYACGRETTQRCPRCAKPYCPDHGSNLCAECLDPVNAAPSRLPFRLALLGLLGGSVLALWLLIQPPSVPGESSPAVRDEPTATPALTPAGAASPGAETPTPVPTTTEPAGEGTPADVATPAPTGAPTEAPTPVPETPPPAAGSIEYVVQEGDSWNGIAAAYGLDATELAAFNGRVLDDFLSTGEVILIPQ